MGIKPAVVQFVHDARHIASQKIHICYSQHAVAVHSSTMGMLEV